MAKKAETKTAGKAKPVVQEVLPAETLPEQQLTITDAGAITSFLANAAAFFTTARRLEDDAKTALTSSRELTLPAVGDVAGDEKLQTFIRTASVDKKAIESHWAITSVIHGFHRKLTSARDRGINALTEAQTNAQRLHNQYEERRKRLEQEERDRQDAENRRRAEEDRQRELDNMERAAVEREQGLAGLSDREQIFVNRILAGDSETAAAKAAQFRDPKVQGDRLINTPKIVAALSNAREALAIRQQKEAHASRPIDVAPAAFQQTAATQKARAGSDVTYHYADIIDERLLVEAILGGKYGIPSDLLVVSPTKLNDYAKSIGEMVNRWPGVRYRKETKTR